MKAISVEKVSNLLQKLDLREALNSWENLVKRPEGFGELCTEDILEIILTNECNARNRKRREILLKMACLPPINADINHIIYNESRDFNFKKTLLHLSTLDFVKEGQNVTIFGGTGTGKTYIAAALLHESCIQGLNGRFCQASDLLPYMAAVHGTPTYARRRAALIRQSVLVIDDFCLTSYNDTELEILYDILNDRYGKHSTIVTSQKSPDAWRIHLGANAMAEALVERIASNNYSLLLSGVSMRSQLNIPNMDI